MLQAALEAERVTLQTRLKDALRLHMTPCTRLDTSSPIDRTVALLDQLLEVCEFDLYRHISLLTLAAHICSS